MKLRRVSLGLCGIAVLSLAVNAILIALILQAHGQAVRAQEQRHQARVLTGRLQLEVEQLGGLARAFSVTRQHSYLDAYMALRAIRDGRQPAPLEYDPAAYWYEVLAGRRQHRAATGQAGQTVEARMRALGGGAAEFAALAQVRTLTGALQGIEQEAFATGQGRAIGVAAQAILFGDAYSRLQADLAGALARLAAATERRTYAQWLAAQQRMEGLIQATMVSLLCSLGLVLVAGWVLQRQVLLPIKALSRAAAALAGGDYTARVGGAGAQQELDGGFGVQELTALGRAVNGMAHAIEQDLHRRNAVQQELERARQASDDASRAKSMFLANMSHEIRTPMNAIIGMAYLALQSGLPARQHGYVTQVHQAATALLGLLNDILDFSKVEAGKMALELAPFRLEDLLADALALVQARAREKGLELLLDVNDRELLAGGGMLVGDALRLGQVLTNLLSNAVKFTHQGSVRLVVQVEQRSGDSVALRLSVRDTGIGMDRQQVAGLFQEFSQADGSTTRKYGGTGLGLAISQRLVAMMDGRITVDSRPGEGTWFSVLLRLRHLPAAAPLPPAPGLAGLRVLIADDMPAARLALQNLLRASGIDGAIDVVASLAAARARIEAAQQAGRPYRLLLLDWEMPQQDGAAWLDELAADGVALPPTVALTVGEPAPDAAPEPLLARLAKPLLPGALRGVLAALVGQPAPAASARPVAPGLSGMRVLLAEDHPVNAQVACELLALQGVQVEWVEHGAAALARLRQGELFHAVLMDVQMPVMDGHEATRQLRQDARFAALPVIAMTAHALEDEQARCAAAGMNGYLRKPVEPATLYAALAPHYAAAPAPAAGQPAARAASVAQLDLQAGLRRAGGNQELYRRLLQDFAAEFAQAAGTLSAQLSAGDWEGAGRLAHTLRGVAATLGAEQLAGLAGELEADCRARAAGAAAALVRLAPVLQQMLAAAQSAAAPAGEAGASWLARLRQLLAHCDSDALACWQACRADAAAVLGQALARRIGAALEQYEFDQALALLPSAPP